MKTKREKLPSHFVDLVRLFPPQAIHDEVAYSNTQEMIDRLTSIPRLTSGQSEYLDTLTILLEAYEKENERIETEHLKPLDVVRHLAESSGMSGSDLGRLLGNRELGIKILNGSRQLSKANIAKLSAHFKVDAGVFL